MRVRLVVLAKSDFLTEGDEGTIRQVAIDMTVTIDETAKKAPTRRCTSSNRS